jgi:DNA-binding SARP family transcriptional activator
MDFAVLGPIRVRDEGRDLALGGPRQRALLAILLLRSNEVVARDRLIDELWGEAPPATARKALQLYVSRLRKVLGPERFQTKSPGYALRVDEEELDLARFERLRARGRHAEALALWRGPALADLADEPFAQIEISRLEELRLACLEDRIDDDLAAGRHLELVAELESLVRAQPLRERLHGQLILALYRSGRQAEALEAYRTARGVLVEEFGIEPSRALRDLQQAVLEQDPELDFATSPAVALARRPFVGRLMR